jgi:hypothetical protein
MNNKFDNQHEDDWIYAESFKSIVGNQYKEGWTYTFGGAFHPEIISGSTCIISFLLKSPLERRSITFRGVSVGFKL